MTSSISVPSRIRNGITDDFTRFHGQFSSDMVGEYLRCLKVDHCGTTYNNHVCVLREICRTLYGKAGICDDPWSGVRLLTDDSHSRREFTIDELQRILEAAKKNIKTMM